MGTKQHFFCGFSKFGGGWPAAGAVKIQIDLLLGDCYLNCGQFCIFG